MPSTLLSRVGGCIAAACMVVCGAAESAGANLTYSFALLEISDISITGATGVNLGMGVSAPPLAQLFNAAIGTDLPIDSHVGTYANVAEWDVQQAKVGPGEAPGQNHFAQGLVGDGSRADSAALAQPPIHLGGFNGSFVAEARRTTVGQFDAIAQYDASFFMVQADNDTPITISFFAETTLIAEKTPAHNAAMASAGLIIQFRDYETDELYLSWSPGGSPFPNPAGDVSGLIESYDLNKVLTAGPGAGAALFTDSGVFNIGFKMDGGQAYRVNFLGGALAHVAVVPAPIPEPSTWVLLACGLLGLGWFGRSSRPPRARRPY